MSGLIVQRDSLFRSAHSPMVAAIHSSGASFTWTNMPLAATLLNGTAALINQYPLGDYAECRLVVNKQGTAGAAASKLILRYAATFSAVAAGYSDIGQTEVSCAVNVTNTVVVSAWIQLAFGAQADVYVAIVGSGGDGVLDPIFGSIYAFFR